MTKKLVATFKAPGVRVYTYDCEGTRKEALDWLLREGRHYSVQEFCIAGDTQITTVNDDGSLKKVSIKELYESTELPLVRVFDEDSKTFKTAPVAEVFDTGVKECFQLTTTCGKTIVAGERHRFLTRNGWVDLKDLKVGSLIAVNGVEAHQDREWLAGAKKRSLENRSGVPGIAKEAGVSYHTIRKWLKIHKLQFTKKETASTYDIWNKGLPHELQPKTGKVCSDETREKMRESSRKGEDSNLHKGSTAYRSLRQRAWDLNTKRRNRLFVEAKHTCAACRGAFDDSMLEVDHILPVWSHPELALTPSNLQVLCKPCHGEKSKVECREARQTVRWKEIAEILPVGKIQTYDLEVEHDSHNYVANGIVSHNSQRYAPVGVAGEQYNTLLARGVANECARAILPTSAPSRLFAQRVVVSKDPASDLPGDGFTHAHFIDGLPDEPGALMAYCARVSNPGNQLSSDYAKLLRYCMKHGHWSVFEQEWVGIRMTAPLYVMHQLARHRTGVIGGVKFLGKLNQELRRPGATSRQASLPTGEFIRIPSPGASGLIGEQVSFVFSAPVRTWFHLMQVRESSAELAKLPHHECKTQGETRDCLIEQALPDLQLLFPEVFGA